MLILCLVCDRCIVDDSGKTGEQVKGLDEVALIRKGKLRYGVCFECFKMSYREFGKTMEQVVRGARERAMIKLLSG